MTGTGVSAGPAGARRATGSTYAVVRLGGLADHRARRELRGRGAACGLRGGRDHRSAGTITGRELSNDQQGCGFGSGRGGRAGAWDLRWSASGTCGGGGSG